MSDFISGFQERFDLSLIGRFSGDLLNFSMFFALVCLVLAGLFGIALLVVYIGSKLND